jgi:hypothetical protein
MAVSPDQNGNACAGIESARTTVHVIDPTTVENDRARRFKSVSPIMLRLIPWLEMVETAATHSDGIGSPPAHA